VWGRNIQKSNNFPHLARRHWTRNSDLLLVEQGKEEVEFLGLVVSVMVCLGLRSKWGVLFSTCFEMKYLVYVVVDISSFDDCIFERDTC